MAILAEGLTELLDPQDLSALGNVERDDHGNIRFAELDIGEVLKDAVQAALKQHGIRLTIVTKNIGYELRCADPIPFDMEYTRDLGYCAAQFLLDGGSDAMVTIDAGRFTPLKFQDMLDPLTGKAKIRLVDIKSEYYQIARQYMTRLESADFNNDKTLYAMATAMHIPPEEFRNTFKSLAE